jgi:hypothetical protein
VYLPQSERPASRLNSIISAFWRQGTAEENKKPSSANVCGDSGTLIQNRTPKVAQICKNSKVSTWNQLESLFFLGSK